MATESSLQANAVRTDNSGKQSTQDKSPDCKKQVFDQQFSEKLDSADFGKLVLHVVIDKAVMRQRAAASLLGA